MARILSSVRFLTYALEQVAVAEKILAEHCGDGVMCACGRGLPCIELSDADRRLDHFRGRISEIIGRDRSAGQPTSAPATRLSTARISTFLGRVSS